MAQRISMISGVAQVQVYGSQKYAVRVQLDPKALARGPSGSTRWRMRSRQGNVNLPTGSSAGTEQGFTLEASGQLMNAEAYRP